jgi:hypothetical protein
MTLLQKKFSQRFNESRLPYARRTCNPDTIGTPGFGIDGGQELSRQQSMLGTPTFD